MRTCSEFYLDPDGGRTGNGAGSLRIGLWPVLKFLVLGAVHEPRLWIVCQEVIIHGRPWSFPDTHDLGLLLPVATSLSGDIDGTGDNFVQEPHISLLLAYFGPTLLNFSQSYCRDLALVSCR